jgi:hypothetical protein
MNSLSDSVLSGGRLLYNLQGSFPFQPPAASILSELSSPEEGTKDEGSKVFGLFPGFFHL